MGNLIKDFWTYNYKGENYFGICEVVKGENIAQNRAEKKYETHIEKALNYVMGRKVLSHMSIQKYSTWLKDRVYREPDEDKYNPFILEFESKSSKDYPDVVYEAAVYVTHLITELQIHEKDILIMINNSRSIYVMVNPKTYGLKPDKDLHKIYFEMYKTINKEIGLKFVDEGIINATYKLMKTPNCFYKGGYFVPITFDELADLLKDTEEKSRLTAKQRSLNFNIPGQASFAMAKIYQEAKEKVKNINKSNTNEVKSCSTGCTSCSAKCVDYFKSALIGKGYRNYALVSVGIQLKNQGYSKEDVINELLELKAMWNHDESDRDIYSKVNTIFRKDYKFSCEYARSTFEDLEIEGLCRACSFNRIIEAKEELKVNGEVINELWKNNASTRHYLMYLELLNKNLLNKWFVPEEEKINDRTVRELCNLTDKLHRERVKGQIFITYKVDYKGYKLPKSFLDNTAPALGDYIKHYLKLIVKGYKALNKYVLIRVSKQKMMSDLGYSDMSGVYKLLSRLEELGLIILKSNSVSCVYYESYIVIDINKYQEEKLIKVAAKYNYVQESFAAVNEGFGANEYINYNHNNRNKKSKRGSPG